MGITWWVIIGVAVIIFSILVYRTLRFGKRAPVQPGEAIPAFPLERMVESLSAAVQCQTISYHEGSIPDGTALRKFHELLKQRYPLAHEQLLLEIVNEYGLLYTWQGSDPSLMPVLFSAHQDVVPVDPATVEQWTKPPFSGEVSDGFVWGRGSIDMKCQLVGILDAIETLVENGFKPERTFYIAFGHDEEVSGVAGAGHISALLKERGVHLAAVWDEGNSILEGVVPGISGPVGLVGVAEKGYMTVDFTVDGKPGHASTPPKQTAIGILAAALAKLEASPMPTDLTSIQNMMKSLGYLLPFGLRMAFANPWLFGGLLVKKLSGDPQTNAAIRTTTAVTIVAGGIKDNILPRQATAKVNFRILPGQTVDQTLAEIKRIIRDDRVQFSPVALSCWNPIPASPTDTPLYIQLQTAIQNTFDQVPVAPFIMLGGTDSRHYASITDAIFRFSPMVTKAVDLKRVHGIDERISHENLEKIVEFILRLFLAWGKG